MNTNPLKEGILMINSTGIGAVTRDAKWRRPAATMKMLTDGAKQARQHSVSDKQCAGRGHIPAVVIFSSLGNENRNRRSPLPQSPRSHLKNSSSN